MTRTELLSDFHQFKYLLWQSRVFAGIASGSSLILILRVAGQSRASR